MIAHRAYVLFQNVGLGSYSKPALGETRYSQYQPVAHGSTVVFASNSIGRTIYRYLGSLCCLRP